MPKLIRVFCVVDYTKGKILYHGCSLVATATALEPGTVYGWGPSYAHSLAHAQRLANEVKGDPLPLAA